MQVLQILFHPPLRLRQPKVWETTIPTSSISNIIVQVEVNIIPTQSIASTLNYVNT
jgi:hypothetical protein